MTQLHAYYHLRNQQAFQRLIDASSDSTKASQGALSSSGGRSWSKPSPLAAAPVCDVNARDWLGMTVLHHVCANTDHSDLPYLRALLAHPAINVNICDLESHWTPLHRALYNGNLTAALFLLRRQDIDVHVKDFEGYTAFDVYNSTVEYTKPLFDAPRAELYTWGTNRNATLGQGDSNDRASPDQAVIHPKDAVSVELPLETRFAPIHVRQIGMSRLHTVIVTAESKGNLRLCGFGSGGRLGPGQPAQQYSMKPLTELNPFTIVSVALGQDHTLALTNTGEVLSWGLNRFAQLGYVIDPPSGSDMSGFARKDEPIQATPRKIPGSLKKAYVLGVAACKTASACWTSKEVFTWGTNNGQLGYDKAAQPVQVHPRVVTKLPYPAEDIALSDNAMVCLLKMDNGTCNVYYIHNDICSKLSFPPHAFPAQIYPYRPPQAATNADIHKVTCCEDNFAALSANGEVFMFSFNSPSSDGSGRTSVKPQRVWALRKQFSADVALGSDGSLIVCTESGHVYLRTRSAQFKASSAAGAQGAGGNKPFKFQRVSHLQRVVRVCANSTGAFGALRMEFQPRRISVEGNRMEQDLRSIFPSEVPVAEPNTLSIRERERGRGRDEARVWRADEVEDGRGEDYGEDDAAILGDREELEGLCVYLEACVASERPARPLKIDVDHGADLVLHVAPSKKPSTPSFMTTAHRVILAARSRPLLRILSTPGILTLKDTGVVIRFGSFKAADKAASGNVINALQFEGCHPLAVLILLVYIYSDQLVPIWDSRLASTLRSSSGHVPCPPTRIKADLQGLAKLLELPHLSVALESPAKRDPAPSLCNDLTALHEDAQAFPSVRSGKWSRRSSPLAPDVVLLLGDRSVWCHSAIMRARSPFFASMFGEEDWTARRWSGDGVIEVNLRHLTWRAMQFVVRYLCCGADEEMFAVMASIQSPDELLDLMYEVMGAANELLLDRLVLICSSVILKFANITNACYILNDATYYHSLPLISSIQEYMAVNMETLLEGGVLDGLSPDLVQQLGQFIRIKQAEKLPITKSGTLVDNAMKEYKDWLALQDIPVPIIARNANPNRVITRRASAKLSPPIPTKLPPLSRTPSSSNILSVPPQHCTPAQVDDIFSMDEAEEPVKPSGPSTPVWKARSVPRVDMKALMAEEANVGSSSRAPQLPVSTPKSAQRTPQRDSVPLPRGVPTNLPAPGPSNTSIASFPALGAAPSKPDASPRRSTTHNSPSASGLGPVFAPTRQPTPSTPTPRRVSSGKAWSSPAPQAPLPASGMTLVAIQQLEIDNARPVAKERRSLVTIQQEEEERRVEEDFLRWWAEEEQRMKVQSEGPSVPKRNRNKDGKPKKPSGKRGSQKMARSTSKPAAS
ncbi:hypothetical protein PC9H_006920 [Pleurotus ostreatus]|uniref:BTB domain-containing protein n=1 Tax=Pleurotus ostreatus TaxID=5322 RepID=A0A8H6ZUP7_PLEOS|nr:uncharacterized protein PC9H_006920 [Pleurotus ostreatus]KAF7431199.1 hypothetical protein PC9H_006920 [Pleurotus ostreatus]